MSTLRTSNLIHGSSAVTNVVLDLQGRATFGPDGPNGRAALYVDPQTNRVGVNTESPTATLTVDGTISTTGDITVGGTLNLTGALSVDAINAGAGTEAAPSISVGTTDNGLYAPATDEVGISTDGTERLRVDASGRVLVGGSTPYVSDATLQIRNDTNAKFVISNPGNATYSLAVGADNDLVFKNESTAIDFLRLDYDGFLIVGDESNANTTITPNGGLVCNYKFSGASTSIIVVNSEPALSKKFAVDQYGKVNINGYDAATYESLDAVNNTTGGDHRLKIRTLANGGGNPYVFFDAGGNNMIVGLKYLGGASNRLMLGTGNNAGGAIGLNINGNGDAFADRRVLIGTSDVSGMTSPNGLKVKSNAVGSASQTGVVLEGTGGDFYSVGWPDCGMYILAVKSSSNRLSIGSDTYGTVAGFYRDGDVQFVKVYNNQITGSTRDVSVTSNGFLGFISSTRESKTNIKSLSDISWLYSLNPVSFNYREKEEDNTFSKTRICPETMYGLIADEVEPIAPELCYHDEDENLVGIEYRKLIPVLLAAVQEQKELIENLEKRLSDADL